MQRKPLFSFKNGFKTCSAIKEEFSVRRSSCHLE